MEAQVRHRRYASGGFEMRLDRRLVDGAGAREARRAERFHPEQRRPQADPQLGRCRQPEQPARRRAVAERMDDLARAGWAVADVRPPAADLADRLRQFDDARLAPRADVEDGRGGRTPPHRGDEGRHRVLDKDEVAGLRSVAEDVDRLAAPYPVAEDRDDAGIGRFGVLSRPVYIEEAQPDRGDAVQLGGDSRVQLAAVFVGGIGRRGSLFRIFADRQAGAIAVDRGGGGIDYRYRVPPAG